MLDSEQASRCALIAGVANTYYTLLMLDAQLATAEETESTWAETVSTMRKLKAAGMSDEAAVTQMEATYYSIRTIVLDLRQQIYETENAMRLMVYGDGMEQGARNQEQGQNSKDDSAKSKSSSLSIRFAAKDVIGEAVVYQQIGTYSLPEGKTQEVKETTRSFRPGRNFTLTLQYQF